tara:strand:- start:38498 stop:38641 length:144 start_codon:yes stop_codon:yes gene_type:complete
MCLQAQTKFDKINFMKKEIIQRTLKLIEDLELINDQVKKNSKNPKRS